MATWDPNNTSGVIPLGYQDPLTFSMGAPIEQPKPTFASPNFAQSTSALVNQVSPSELERLSSRYNGDTEYFTDALGRQYGSQAEATQSTQQYNEGLAYANEQEGILRGMLDRTNTGLSQGLTALEDSYNQSQSGLNKNRSRDMENYQVKRQDTEMGKQNAIGRVDTNARTLADSLRRRIGLASGAGSSAYQITAPGAVARDAGINRQGVMENYGRNFRDIGMAESRAEEDYNSAGADLLNQRKTRESGLRQGILEQQNGITGSLADLARRRAALQGGDYNAIQRASAPYQNEINTRNSAIDGLFNQFRTPYSVKAVQAQAPTLRDYIVDRAQINQTQSGGAPDPTAPYNRPLNQEDDEELL